MKYELIDAVGGPDENGRDEYRDHSEGRHYNGDKAGGSDDGKGQVGGLFPAYFRIVDQSRPHKHCSCLNQSHEPVKAILDDSAVALFGHDLTENGGDEEVESVVDENDAEPGYHHSDGDAEVLLSEQHFCWNLLY